MARISERARAWRQYAGLVGGTVAMLFCWVNAAVHLRLEGLPELIVHVATSAVSGLTATEARLCAPLRVHSRALACPTFLQSACQLDDFALSQVGVAFPT
jgi:hypothetical protein